VSHTEKVISVALPFVWLGLVIGISAIETPLKFRAPGITTELGLGIGRLVFRALNLAEIAIAAVLAVVVTHRARDWTLALLCVIIALLLVQTLYVRRKLDARVVRIIAGENVAPSSLHIAYIALEGVKLVLLPALGAGLAWRWLA
jgi:hypothetical protein